MARTTTQENWRSYFDFTDGEKHGMVMLERTVDAEKQPVYRAAYLMPEAVDEITDDYLRSGKMLVRETTDLDTSLRFVEKYIEAYGKATPPLLPSKGLVEWGVYNANVFTTSNCFIPAPDVEPKEGYRVLIFDDNNAKKITLNAVATKINKMVTEVLPEFERAINIPETKDITEVLRVAADGRKEYEKSILGSERFRVQPTEVPMAAAVVAKGGSNEYMRPNGSTYFARHVGAYKDVEFLREARNKGLQVLLYGPPGAGKSALIEAAFSELGEDGALRADFLTLNCTAYTEESDLLGTWMQDPHTKSFIWHNGPLLEAMNEGKVLFVDDVTMANPKVLASLYSAMDDRHRVVVTMNPDMPPVEAKPGFYVVGAHNPDAPGAVLSDALRSRFSLELEVQSDFAGLSKMLGIPPKAAHFAEKVALQFNNEQISWVPQIRELIAYRDSLHFGEEVAVRNLLGKFPVEDRANALNAAKGIWNHLDFLQKLSQNAKITEVGLALE